MASQTVVSAQTKTLDLPRLMVGAGLLAGVLFTGGTYWDGSWHLEYGRDTFWSPPHLLIYGAILMMFVIAVASFSVAALSTIVSGSRMCNRPCCLRPAVIAGSASSGLSFM